ncbi:MAG: hypothetical protein WBC71_15060 [Salaquimonas sp.]
MTVPQALVKTDFENEATDLVFADKRKSVRDPAHDLSEIILDGKKSGVSCLIHDLSAEGAKLEVSCGELPKRFVLANYSKRTKTLCGQVWRDKRMVGVKFLTRPRSFEIKVAQ